MSDNIDFDVYKVPILGKESIHCGFHLVPYIVRTVVTTLPASSYVLITDSHVAKFYLDGFKSEFEAFLGSKYSRFLSYIIPPGESTKSREGKADIEDFLLLQKCTRDTVVLALGGGVIGDLVGFVAATFMRGVRFVQIPTTLLAMVDSSVGGKTAIDTPHGKNLIGAFWQPEYIFIDAAFLETLPAREFSNGMAEVIKTAAIWNESEFADLESRSAEIFAAIQTPSADFAGRTESTRSEAQKLLLSVIKGSIGVKAHIVTIDERETGLRNLVNFGHTIGHAIEAVLTPTILHGECVSVGMILEAEIARSMGVLGQVAVGRLSRTLKAYNLPISLSDPRIANLPAAKLLSVERLLDIMAIDKKNSGKGKKIVILNRIGATYEQKATVIPDPLISKVLSEAATVISGMPSKHPIRMSTPGSKSISNRALVLAALGSGTCKLKNLLHSDDTQVMMTALIELHGARFSWEDGGETLVVEGGGGRLEVPSNEKEIYLGNAGTAARFLTTVCALAQPSSAAPELSTIITGNARMKQRPIGPLVDALRANGSDIAYQESQGCLPLSIKPNGFKGGHIQLAATVSSQYVSSILLCAPYAQENVVLELTGGAVISQPYIDMTIAMMRTFGVDVIRRSDADGKPLDIYEIPKATYRNPGEYNVESDASSATYPLAIAAITGTECTIANIGTASLQGDARFAKEVLEPMGCEVIQTETETTVRGLSVGQLKAIGYIDMEPMTDAFLTASVLAAVATGTPLPGRELKDTDGTNVTRILGISNQRVKECNRIKAMIDQLAKFGVQTKELDDGLEVYGKPISELKEGASVHCYDDHRVAMAFSVLGTVISNTIIEEKRCVEKTWPNWWDDLENKIGLKVEGVELARDDASASGITSSDSSASVLIVGMRGSGKTFVGRSASEILGWPFVDADEYFVQVHKIGVRQFVHDKGWLAFREAETEILKEIVSKYGTGHVISLGGGIVETPVARETLEKYAASQGRIVYVVREIDEIVAYLGSETARPAYGESITDVYTRRQPWYSECSNYEFVNYTGLSQAAADVSPSVKQGTREEIRRFFHHITGQQPNLSPNLVKSKRSYFLSLTYPDLTPALPHINTLSIGVDAIELRVDLLRAPTDIDVRGSYIPPLAYVATQLAALRRASTLPVVYTVRSVSQGGSFPDTAEKEAFELFDLGLRQGAEYIDVEITWPEKAINALTKRKGSSKIIASYHDWSGNLKWSGPVVKGKYGLAAKLGDIVKIVGKANKVQDNFELYNFIESVTSHERDKPFIAINMGQEGQISRILNPTFSPVTHQLLPSKAAPGQVSFVEIQKALHLLGLLPAKQFYIFGNPIAHSMSPTLHNTAFETLGLPHHYQILETDTMTDNAEIKAVLENPEFGGASVTIPFKLDVISLLDTLSPAAKAIGAVNTIIPIVSEDGSSRTLHGDNTDWIGISESVRTKLEFLIANTIASLPTPSELGPELLTVPEAGLVIGAGGTARAALYALYKLGIKHLYLYNRTESKAQALADEFSSTINVGNAVQVIRELESWPGGVAPTVIVSTIPAPGQTEIALTSALFAGASRAGVVVEMAYKPAETPLLKLVKDTAQGWQTVTGVEVLLEQGYKQFELWTGRRAPRDVIAKKVFERYNAA